MTRQAIDLYTIYMFYDLRRFVAVALAPGVLSPGFFAPAF